MLYSGTLLRDAAYACLPSLQNNSHRTLSNRGNGQEEGGSRSASKAFRRRLAR